MDKLQATAAIAEALGIAQGEPFPVEVDRSKGDGETICLFHRAHQWSEKYYAPLMPLCAICGGRCDPRLEAHELCKARARIGGKVQKLDSFGPCACMACVKTRKN